MISDEKFAKAAAGLARAALMSADDLAKEKGEDNLFVKVKRNRELLGACSRHDFEPQPDWRAKSGGLLREKVRCRACGGEMEVGDVSMYLRGIAHASGQDHATLINAIWPPG